MLKRIFGEYTVFAVISIIVVMANGYVICAFPSSIVLDIFWPKVSAQKIERRNYNPYMVVGLPAGRGIQVLENREQFDTIPFEDHYEYYTFVTESIIPLDAYQLKSGTDTLDNVYYNGSYRMSTGTQWPTYTDDALGILWKRNIYNRYYLVALPDGNYVVAYLDDAYYLKYLLTGKVKLPVGYAKFLNNLEKELLQPSLEKYGMTEEKQQLIMFSDDRYEAFKGLYKGIPLFVYVCNLVVYFVVGFLILELIERIKGGKKK